MTLAILMGHALTALSCTNSTVMCFLDPAYTGPPPINVYVNKERWKGIVAGKAANARKYNVPNASVKLPSQACPCRVSVTLSQTSLTLTSGVSHSRNALRYSCIYLLYNNYYGNPGTRPFSILRHAGCPQLQCSLPEVAGGRGNLLHVLPVHTGGQPRAARRGGSLGGHVLDSFWEGRTWRRFGKDVHGAEDSVL